MTNYITNRLTSRSTYIGIGLLASSAHYQYIAEVLEETIHVLSTLLGIIMVFIPHQHQLKDVPKEP